MSPNPMNIAARMGRWSATHRKTAIFGWLAFVLVAIALGQVVGVQKLDPDSSGAGESARAQAILKDAGFKQPASEVVLVQSPTAKTTTPAFQAAVKDVVERVSASPDVRDVRSPFASGNDGQISADGRSALVEFSIRGPAADAHSKVEPILDEVAAAQKEHPAFAIEQFGDASAEKALDDTVGKDFSRAELLSLPITLAILLVAFGALVAAGIPVLLGITAVGASLGLLAVFSHLIPVDDAANSVILLIGLAVGVDYSLFYLKREREERAAGRTSRAAIEAAAATSGRSVLISGLTVLAAMAGMFFTGNMTFTGIAVGTMIVVSVAVIGSLTVLPAVLSVLGDRVEKGRVPFLRRRQKADGEGRVWSAILDRVLRRPLLSALVAGGLLVALTVPAFTLHTSLPDISDMPKSLAIVQTYERIEAAFPGGSQPATVVVKAPDVTAPAVRQEIDALKKKALASGEMFEPIAVTVNPAGTVARISVPLAGNGTDDASNRALATLRDDVIPETVGSIGGTTVAVTGVTAGSLDFNDQMKAHAPYVFAFVLVLAFVLLLVAFRSVVIAGKAIVLNLLSVGAAYGLLVLVFQRGLGESVLGFTSTGAITSWLPLFLFVVLFGLSMDYHVFILSRIREAYDRGMSTESAISHGIKTTAGVVTSAALVMVAVFSVFMTLSTVEMKQLGFGLAAAILIDATIVRAILLPATMKLLGRWNWYLPSWLGWLPRIDVAERPSAARASGR